ncbi:MAG: hypothetical protein QGH77_08740, partial [Planctomycetota bacterium]|nr:hypothetical protein [Planctomycetota bacterium]
MAETETQDLNEEVVEMETEVVIEEQPPTPDHDTSHPTINQDEVVEDFEREDLEDKYLDLKDEVWR